MAVDEDEVVAQRIRERLTDADVTERRMFGGLAFMSRQRLFVPLLVVLATTGCSPVRPPATDNGPQAIPAVESEWVRIHPAGETECAFETPYSFFYHEGPTPTKLLVYFEGGGACWEFVSCSGMFDTSVNSDELAMFRGIFDFTKGENPFREYSVLFIPYCSGDVHIGDTVQIYGDPASTRPVAHRGYRNVSAALAWLSGRPGKAPTQVVVSGTSAGSYGALFYAPAIARLYPSAAITLIGDSGVPLLKDYPDVMLRWGTAGVVAKLRSAPEPLLREELTLERAHTYFAEVRPKALLAQVTSDRDAIQSAFYLISGSPAAREATYELLDSVQRVVPAFRSFVVAGADHGLFVTDKFYAYTSGDVRLVDWLERALAGQQVEGRRCGGCVDP